MGGSRLGTEVASYSSSGARLEKRVSVHLSSLDIADAFCRLGSREQTQVIADIARLMSGWGGARDAFQIRFIADGLNHDDREVLVRARWWLRELVACLDSPPVESSPQDDTG